MFGIGSIEELLALGFTYHSGASNNWWNKSGLN
jgi:hypothetical protein